MISDRGAIVICRKSDLVRHIVSGSIGIIYLDGISAVPARDLSSRAGTALHNSDATGFDISW